MRYVEVLPKERARRGWQPPRPPPTCKTGYIMGMPDGIARCGCGVPPQAVLAASSPPVASAQRGAATQRDSLARPRHKRDANGERRTANGERRRTSNVERRTSNIEHRTSNRREKDNAFCLFLSPLLFDVGRSTFDVRCLMLLWRSGLPIIRALDAGSGQGWQDIARLVFLQPLQGLAPGGGLPGIGHCRLAFELRDGCPGDTGFR